MSRLKSHSASEFTPFASLDSGASTIKGARIATHRWWSCKFIESTHVRRFKVFILFLSLPFWLIKKTSETSWKAGKESRIIVRIGWRSKLSVKTWKITFAGAREQTVDDLSFVFSAFHSTSKPEAIFFVVLSTFRHQHQYVPVGLHHHKFTSSHKSPVRLEFQMQERKKRLNEQQEKKSLLSNQFRCCFAYMQSFDGSTKPTRQTSTNEKHYKRKKRRQMWVSVPISHYSFFYSRCAGRLSMARDDA